MPSTPHTLLTLTDLDTAIREEPVIVIQNRENKFFVGMITSIDPKVTYEEGFSCINELTIGVDSLLPIEKIDEEGENIFDPEKWVVGSGEKLVARKIAYENISQLSCKKGILHLQCGVMGFIYISYRQVMLDFMTKMTLKSKTLH